MATNPTVEKILDDLHSKRNFSGHLKLEGEEEKRAKMPVQLARETKSGYNKPEPSKVKLGHQFEEAARSARNDKLAAEKAPKHSFLDETVTIKFNPRRFVKWTVIALLFISVFYIGRLTGGETDSLETAATPAALAAASTAEEPAAEESFISGLSGFFTKIIPDFSDESDDTELSVPEEVVAAETAETTATNTTSETNTTAAVPEPAPEPAAEPVEVNEPIITTYSRVSLSIEGVNIDWKETWGKITKLSYKIVNKEAGTVKPSYFLMIVEGYDDYDKRIDLPKNSQIIKSMKSVSSVATIPDGFSYSQLETGDLATVQITLQLYDANGVLITAVNKNMDLSG